MPAKADIQSKTQTSLMALADSLSRGVRPSAIKGWDEAAQRLGEHAEPVIDFLKNFLPQ